MKLLGSVISISVEAEGLPVTHGRDILIADTPATFADYTVAMVSDSSARECIGLAARELAEGRYKWARATDVLEGVLTQLVRKALE